MERNDNRALEELLQSAKLRAPSGRLNARLESVFASTIASQSRNLWLRHLAIAAGVAIIAAATIWFVRPAAVDQHVAAKSSGPSPTTEVARSEPPIRIERDISETIDDGVIAVEDNTPYEQTRRETIRDIWFIDRQTNARIRIRVPIEQVTIQKVEAF